MGVVLGWFVFLVFLLRLWMWFLFRVWIFYAPERSPQTCPYCANVRMIPSVKGDANINASSALSPVSRNEDVKAAMSL